MTKKMNYTLWAIQVLLALLFLFAGAMKLIMPIAEMTKQMPMSITNLRVKYLSTLPPMRLSRTLLNGRGAYVSVTAVWRDGTEARDVAAIARWWRGVGAARWEVERNGARADLGLRI